MNYDIVRNDDNVLRQVHERPATCPQLGNVGTLSTSDREQSIVHNSVLMRPDKKIVDIEANTLGPSSIPGQVAAAVTTTSVQHSYNKIDMKGRLPL